MLMKKYKAVIFDLDGTLLDTLKGITDAVNLTFKELGYNVQHDYVTARHFIGAGAMNFVKRAADGLTITPEEGKKIGDTFLMYYDKISLTFFIAMTYYVYRYMWLIEDINDYIDFLRYERMLSENTISSYQSDLFSFYDFLSQKNANCLQ